MALTIRLKTIDGQWETLGAYRMTGLHAENVELSSNVHGSDTARFVLKRDPGISWPDLLAFTPIEVEDHGTVVWSGRIWETPSKEGSDQQITVEARGWQYHLDDQPIVYPFTKIRLEAKDARQVLTANLQQYVTSGQVSIEGRGDVVIGFGKGTEVANQHTACAIFDLGPDYEYFRPYLFLELESNLGSDAGFDCYVRTHNSPDPLSMPVNEYTDLFIKNYTTFPRGQTQYVETSAGDARRYVSVFLWRNGAATLTDEFTVKIKNFCVYAYGAYKDARKHSQLRASDVITESVKRACPLIKKPEVQSTTIADEILGNPTLAGYWKFDIPGPSGNVPDRGPGGYHLSQTGMAPTYRVDTPLDNQLGDEDPNGAMSFSDSNTVFKNTSFTGVSIRCAMAVVFAAPVPQTESILVYWGGSGTNGWGLTLGGPGGGDHVWVLVGGVNWYDTGIVHDGEPMIVIASYEPQGGGANRFSAEAYKLNDPYPQLYVSPVVTPNTPGAPAGIYIAGQDGFTPNRYFTGVISDVAIFSEPFDAKAQYGYIDYIDESVPVRLNRASLNKQRGSVQHTGFWIPELPVDQAQTPRELIDAANTFHDFCWKVNHEPTVEFNPKPDTAQYEIGTWSGAEFEDASANAAEEIYNEVRVEATDYLGQPLVATSGGLKPSSVHYFANPDFEVDASNWSATNGSISRNTTIKYAGTASGEVSSSAGLSPSAIANLVGDFKPGRIYRVEGMMYRTANGAGDDGELLIRNDHGATEETKVEVLPGGNASFWFPFGITFQFSTYGDLSIEIQQQAGAIGAVFYLDQMRVLTTDDSIPSRQGFIRTKILPIQAAMTPAAIQKVGDVWLASNSAVPFKGSLKQTRPGGIRRLIGGAEVQPAHMLNATCEKILFSHRADPETGEWGREGMIYSVQHDGNSGVSTITIDNTRQSFESLISRYSAVVGTVR